MFLYGIVDGEAVNFCEGGHACPGYCFALETYRYRVAAYFQSVIDREEECHGYCFPIA